MVVPRGVTCMVRVSITRSVATTICASPSYGARICTARTAARARRLRWRHDAHHVRRLIVVGGAAPADAEALRGHRAARVVGDDQAIRAVAQAILGDAQRLAWADIDGRAVDWNVAAGATPSPLAAVEIPIVAPVFAHELPLHAVHADALALRVHRDHVISDAFAGAGAAVFERRLQADIDVRQSHRHREALTHHASARIGDAGDDARAQRQRRVRLCSAIASSNCAWPWPSVTEPGSWKTCSSKLSSARPNE